MSAIQTQTQNTLNTTFDGVTQVELNTLVAAEMTKLTDQLAPQTFTAFQVALNLRTQNPKTFISHTPYVDRTTGESITGVQTLVHEGMQRLLNMHPQFYEVNFDPSIGPNGAHVYSPSTAPVTQVTVSTPAAAVMPANTTKAPAQLPAVINPIRWGSDDGI
jgi:hypothetical protein